MIYCPWHVITSFLRSKNAWKGTKKNEGSSLRSVSPAVPPQAEFLPTPPPGALHSSGTAGIAGGELLPRALPAWHRAARAQRFIRSCMPGTGGGTSCSVPVFKPGGEKSPSTPVGANLDLHRHPGHCIRRLIQSIFIVFPGDFWGGEEGRVKEAFSFASPCLAPNTIFSPQ